MSLVVELFKLELMKLNVSCLSGHVILNNHLHFSQGWSRSLVPPGVVVIVDKDLLSLLELSTRLRLYPYVVI